MIYVEYRSSCPAAWILDKVIEVMWVEPTLKHIKGFTSAIAASAVHCLAQSCRCVRKAQCKLRAYT